MSAGVAGFDHSVVFVVSSLFVVPMVGGVVCVGAAAAVMIDSGFGGWLGGCAFGCLCCGVSWVEIGAAMVVASARLWRF